MSEFKTDWESMSVDELEGAFAGLKIARDTIPLSKKNKQEMTYIMAEVTNELLRRYAKRLEQMQEGKQ